MKIHTVKFVKTRVTKEKDETDCVCWINSKKIKRGITRTPSSSMYSKGLAGEGDNKYPWVEQLDLAS